MTFCSISKSSYLFSHELYFGFRLRNTNIFQSTLQYLPISTMLKLLWTNSVYSLSKTHFMCASFGIYCFITWYICCWSTNSLNYPLMIQINRYCKYVKGNITYYSLYILQIQTILLKFYASSNSNKFYVNKIMAIRNVMGWSCNIWISCFCILILSKLDVSMGYL